MWDKPPYWKGKGFCPNPIALNGIPKYADSIRDKRVIGTPDHQKFWEEQLYYVNNGYAAGGGIYLSGFLYYYYNFRKLPTELGPIYPWYHDLHVEIHNFIEYIKSVRKNGVFPKGRRGGISEIFCAYMDYNYRFKLNSYRAGVASGNDDYIQDFMSKWRYGDSLIVPEFRINTLTDNEKEVIAGYEIKEDGTFIESGSRNTFYTRTMGMNPNLFKGLLLNDVIIEELGEFNNVIRFIAATEDCLRRGSYQFGNMWAFGTGGSDTTAFRELIYNAEAMNFEVFFIRGTRFYMPYFGRAKDDHPSVPIIPNLLTDHKSYQCIGVDDELAAEEFIKKERDRLSKAGDPKKYLEYKQNRPLTIQDVLVSTVVNDFDSEKLNTQNDRISALVSPKYSKFRLEWVKDNNGGIPRPYRVKAIPIKTGEDESECVYIIDSEHPRTTHRHLYVAGIDSYDQDTSRTSKSLGAMCVMIRENHIQFAMKKSPVAVIRTRPARKEKFYELCLKLSVYYNIENNVLIDVRCPAIIQYFKDRSADTFLAKRPSKYEKENSEQGHDFGVSLNTYSKPLMVSLMQTHVVDYSQEIWFNSNLDVGPNLITELQNYDEIAIGSDNDLADAYGIALMQDGSSEIKPKDISNDDKNDTFDLPEYRMGKDGNVYLSDGDDEEFSQHTEDGIRL